MDNEHTYSASLFSMLFVLCDKSCLLQYQMYEPEHIIYYNSNISTYLQSIVFFAFSFVVLADA